MRIETYRFFGLCVVIASGAAMMACSDSGTGAGKAGSAGSTATTGGTGGSPGPGASTTVGTGGGTATGTGGTGGGSASPCVSAPALAIPVTQALISDFDGEAGLTVTSQEPRGAWTLSKDPSPAGTAAVTLGACGTTGTGLHFTGNANTMWGATAAGTFIGPAAPVNASAYTGVSFVLKSAAAVPVYAKMTNPDSQPACGLCMDTTPATPGLECYAGYQKLVSADTTGSVQTIKFLDYTKTLWGYHFPMQFTVDPTQIIDMSFTVDQNTPTFDLCIDDVKFVQ